MQQAHYYYNLIKGTYLQMTVIDTQVVIRLPWKLKIHKVQVQHFKKNQNPTKVKEGKEIVPTEGQDGKPEIVKM